MVGYCRPESQVILRQFFSPEEVAAKKAAAAGLLQRACAKDGGFRQLERLDEKEGHVPIGGCPWSAARVRAGADALPGDPANPGRVTYIDDVHAVDAEMERHARDPKLLGALQHLLGDEIDGYQMAFVVKPPQSDITYHGWHQVPLIHLP